MKKLVVVYNEATPSDPTCAIFANIYVYDDDEKLETYRLSSAQAVEHFVPIIATKHNVDMIEERSWTELLRQSRRTD